MFAMVPEPAIRPPLELGQRGLEISTHLRELVLDPQRWPWDHASLNHATRLELLHPLGQQPVRQLGHGLGDLREPKCSVHQDSQDGACPTPPDELYRLVVERAAMGDLYVGLGVDPRPLARSASSLAGMRGDRVIQLAASAHVTRKLTPP